MSTHVSLSELVSHAAWLRRLALGLLRDPAAADDAVQSTLVAAWRHPPTGDRDVRPWLAEVTRNQAHDQRRGESRRRMREAEAVARAETAGEAMSISPEALIGDHEIHRQVAEVVAALDEPYRSTLVLHYYDGVDSAEMARRLDLAPGTVRWRIKEGLDRVRVALDARNQGDRTRWQKALLPLLPLPVAVRAPVAGSVRPGASAVAGASGAAAPSGALVPGVLVAVILIVVLGAVTAWLRRGDASRSPAPMAETPRASGHRSSSADPPVPDRSPPRFAAAAPNADPDPTAATQARADHLLRRMLGAVLDDTYDDFVLAGGDIFKAVVTRDTVTELNKTHARHLSGGYEIEAVGQLARGGVSDLGDQDPGPFTLFLWKLTFRDGSDDLLVRLAVAKDHIIGFFVE